MEPEFVVEKKGRRNLLGSIERRLKSGTYNKNKNLKRNLRTLREKMREFNKKGELKPFVRARYDATRGLLGDLEKFEEVGTAVPAARRRLNNALKYAKGSPVPRALVPMASRAHLMEVGRLAREAMIAEGEVPAPAVAPMVLKKILTKKNGNAAAPRKSAKTLKRTKSLTNEETEYMKKVEHKYLPLPELYNPYTGVKYKPENNPLPNINSAYEMLHSIREKAKRDARMLKKAEEE
jgi:hypothetical protein